MRNPDELAFEELICRSLVDHGGYDVVKDDSQRSGIPEFDAELGLDTAELFAFIGATQLEQWDELTKQYGGDAGRAQREFCKRLVAELDRRGVVDVLRRGVYHLGVTIQLAFFRPASGITPELVARYQGNRLTVTRQLRYQPGETKALDLALFVNGIPVATAELKNPLTGQGVDHAIAQYRNSRDPRNRTLARAVVHFAVDPQRVAMTTRLTGPDTQFLPFNQGHDRGAGNPPNPDGHATAYLWERVWARDAWLNLLHRFVQVQKPSRGSRKPGRVIFPRYHQWDAVLRLEEAARAEGPGHSYLVQHSAGSGKSNTIAWLAHRLSTLHAGDDKVFDKVDKVFDKVDKVFDKVVVITDRVVLDRQLQDTIYDFEHTYGVVERIERSSQQLADALLGAQARIVITTLQKFPYVLDRVGGLPDRSYAVIVDEAHSSQTGDAAQELRRVLGSAAGAVGRGTGSASMTRSGSDTDSAGDAGIGAEGGTEGDLPVDAVEQALAGAVAARGRQPNLSFFAFTATPKGKTLELFGRKNPDTGTHEPFHEYTMRQAIEERFILDVLANYTTYATFFRIEKAIADDPDYQTAQARRAIAQYVTLHETNLAQKADIVVEHFRRRVAHKVGGQAKAMVVCSSRPHAVRFWQALRQHITDHGYDIGVLVAFSDQVTINGEEPVSEAGCNGFSESQTAQRFDSDHYQIMVVAEKFQTGFDQPKLYAMYVDKTLTDLAAVQTLSRLNRTHPAKDGTFVLDFVNQAPAIVEAFEPYYGTTVALSSDPNLLYDTRRALDEYGVLDAEEAGTFARLLLTDGADHGRLHAALGPAVSRFDGLADDEKDRFRDSLGRFVRVYSFLSQIVSFADTVLERDYLFAKALQAMIRAAGGEAVDLSRDLELTHLRTEQQFSGSVALASDVGTVTTIRSGAGPEHEPEPEPLSVIIERINARHGTNLTDADLLVMEGAADDLVADIEAQVRAVNTSPENFDRVFPTMFRDALLSRMDRNEQAVFRFLDDEELAADITRMYATLVRARLLVAYQEHCPIGELLGPDREGVHLEYKCALRTSQAGEISKVMEAACVKTVAAFATSREGGTLLIGVDDGGTPVGLAGDYASLAVSGKDDRDLFLLHLNNLHVTAFGEAVAATVTTQVHTVDSHDICRVHVPPSRFAVYPKVRDSHGHWTTTFYVRVGNTTREVTDPGEIQRYIAQRWGSW